MRTASKATFLTVAIQSLSQIHLFGERVRKRLCRPSGAARATEILRKSNTARIIVKEHGFSIRTNTFFAECGAAFFAKPRILAHIRISLMKDAEGSASRAAVVVIGQDESLAIRTRNTARISSKHTIVHHSRSDWIRCGRPFVIHRRAARLLWCPASRQPGASMHRTLHRSGVLSFAPTALRNFCMSSTSHSHRHPLRYA